MSNLRIVCTEQTGCTSSGHIVGVGVGTEPNQASQNWTVAEVYAAMDAGHIFYTQDHLGNVALVDKYKCGCSRGSIRSAPDHTKANNLDSLRICAWA